MLTHEGTHLFCTRAEHLTLNENKFIKYHFNILNDCLHSSSIFPLFPLQSHSCKRNSLVSIFFLFYSKLGFFFFLLCRATVTDAPSSTSLISQPCRYSPALCFPDFPLAASSSLLNEFSLNNCWLVKVCFFSFRLGSSG